jgi:hypothetical protein
VKLNALANATKSELMERASAIHLYALDQLKPPVCIKLMHIALFIILFNKALQNNRSINPKPPSWKLGTTITCLNSISRQATENIHACSQGYSQVAPHTLVQICYLEMAS